MSDAALAVDLGGTNIRAALVTRRGEIRHVVNDKTRAEEGPEAVIGRMVGLIEQVIAAAQPAAEVRLGVVAPGPLNPETGVLYYGPNLPGWHDVPLRDILEERLGRQVVVGNDGNSAALGEFMFGAGVDVEHLIYIALGTGVGGGIVSHGRLIEGTRGLGAEVGHISIDPSGPRCHCGGIGCIEAYAGGWAIARDGRLLVQSARASGLQEARGDGPITPRLVAEAALAGDAAARELYRRAGRALGVGLAGLINVFNPQMLVIGGGVAEAGDLILDPLREALESYTMPQMLSDLTIRRSALGTDTGIFGAAARVFYTVEGTAAVLGG